MSRPYVMVVFVACLSGCRDPRRWSPMWGRASAICSFGRLCRKRFTSNSTFKGRSYGSRHGSHMNLRLNQSNPREMYFPPLISQDKSKSRQVRVLAKDMVIMRPPYDIHSISELTLDLISLMLHIAIPLMLTVCHSQSSNCDLLTRRDILWHRRTREVLPSIEDVPNQANEGETSKHHTCVVHCCRLNRQANRHAEQHQGQTDPQYHGDINRIAKFSERVRRVLDSMTAANDRDEDRHAVAG